jgi:lysophospholipase L1-like esterase
VTAFTATSLISGAVLSLGTVLSCGAQTCQRSAARQAAPAAAAPVHSGSVCRFPLPGVPGLAEADGRVRIPPNHPGIVYMGRVDCKADAVTFAYPGASIRVRLSGSALEFLYADQGAGGERSTNYFAVTIDGAPPTLLALDPKRTSYRIAENLGAGEHVVELFKRTESSQVRNTADGQGKFLGFRVPKGATLLPPAARRHRVEFIGDSITCGYGADLSTEHPENYRYSSKNADAYASWAALTARELDADLMLVAYSGRGVYRNFASSAGEPMPELYLRTLPDDESSFWDFRVFDPEVVVVNLGTNDFSPGGVDRKRFREAYARFLASLRMRYPKVPLIVTIGPMLSDSFPAGEKAWTNIQADIASVLEERRRAGERNTHLLTIEPQTAPFGEDWHPTAAEHRFMAQKVTELIRRLLNW